MRSFLVLSLSATVLSGCLTSQENPNYEHSTAYRGDTPAQNQYADAASAPITYQSAGQSVGAGYQSTSVGYQADGTATPSVSLGSPEAQMIFARTGATDPSFSTAAYSATAQATTAPTAPTDSLYGAAEVTGTPGFMAMQSAQQPATTQVAAQALPAAQYVATPPLKAAGTPIAYDYSRNIIAADAVTTGQSLPETVRVIPSAGQNYTVQQGDTVYGLSRKTCVGVNVIQSMNGLTSDYAIKIGQSIRLPQSVC